MELVYEDAQCSLRVKDDGQGFGVVGVPPSGGFGLLGMSERAERITIELEPTGQGTELHCQPLSENHDRPIHYDSGSDC